MCVVDVIVDLSKGENRLIVESEIPQTESKESINVHISGHYMPQDG